MLGKPSWGEDGFRPVFDVSGALKRVSTAWRWFVGAVGSRLRLRDQSGQAIVEFAFVAVPLCIILFGIIELGMAWNRQNDAVHLANEAVRMAAVNTSTGTICSTLRSEVTSNGISAGAVSLQITGGAVGSASTATVSGIPIANVVPNLVPGIPASVHAAASMRLEQAFVPLGPVTLNAC